MKEFLPLIVPTATKAMTLIRLIEEPTRASQDESAVEIKEFPRQRPLIVQVLQRLRGSGPDAAFLAGE